LDRESKIKKFHPKEFIYLWYVGVEPTDQGKGIGSSLLQDIINLSNKRKLPIYLETSTERNLPLYERFKFEKYQELNFNYTLYLYKKESE
jgi:ribosomal protein S18 acetylase RimI-like enzyme